MLLMAGVAPTGAAARRALQRSIDDGSALQKFKDMVAAQGGDARVVDDPSLLPQAPVVLPVPSRASGYVKRVDALAVALAAAALGAGRRRAEDTVDPSVGVSALVKVGEYVRTGDALCVVHAASDAAATEAAAALLHAVELGDDPPTGVRALIAGIVE